MNLTEDDKGELLYALEYNHDTRTFPKNPKELHKQITSALKLQELVKDYLKKYDKPDGHDVQYCAIEIIESLIEESER